MTWHTGFALKAERMKKRVWQGRVGDWYGEQMRQRFKERYMKCPDCNNNLSSDRKEVDTETSHLGRVKLVKSQSYCRKCGYTAKPHRYFRGRERTYQI
jgi:uncharacterized protein with PIN domain